MHYISCLKFMMNNFIVLESHERFASNFDHASKFAPFYFHLYEKISILQNLFYGKSVRNCFGHQDGVTLCDSI